MTLFNMIKKLSLLFILLISSLVSSQFDFASWNSFQIKYKLNDKSTVIVKPIIRYNNNLSSFQNAFFDTSFDYKIHKKWKVKILNRVVSDFTGKYGLAFFFDISHKTKINNSLQLINKFRYHLGLDLELFHRDFLRYEPKFISSISKKIDLITAVDFTYNFKNSLQIFRYRYQIGLIHKINKNLGYSLFYWFEQFPRNANRHLIVSSLIFSFNK